jgi:hypothetical protein
LQKKRQLIASLRSSSCSDRHVASMKTITIEVIGKLTASPTEEGVRKSVVRGPVGKLLASLLYTPGRAISIPHNFGHDLPAYA